MTTNQQQPITDAALATLERLARAATPGPWECDGDSIHLPGSPMDELVDYIYEMADAAYIAAANPSAVLALVERLRSAEGRAERAQEREEYLATEALFGLAGAISTPAEGYRAIPQLLRSDIRRLVAERDTLRADLAKAREDEGHSTAMMLQAHESADDWCRKWKQANADLAREQQVGERLREAIQGVVRDKEQHYKCSTEFMREYVTTNPFCLDRDRYEWFALADALAAAPTEEGE